MKEEWIKNQLEYLIDKKGIHLEHVGINNYGFERETALQVVDLLRRLKISILGGDVYQLKDNKVVPTYDNWSAEMASSSNKLTEIENSIKKAKQYITTYSEPSDTKIIYILVIDSEEYLMSHNG